jgi:hypothetical protein
MGISMIIALPIGNALRIFIEPPAAAELWRVLRTTGTSFASESDPSATVVFQGDMRSIVDADGLANGVAYTYGAFFYDGTQWTAGAVAVGTPLAAYQDNSTDVLSLVRDRLEVGLQNEVARKTLTPQDGAIEVLNAPPAFEDSSWPLVTVHVTTDGSGERALGEDLSPDFFDPLGGLFDQEDGWLARVHLTIVGWSKNPDERIAMRKALRRLVIGNLPVFDAAGLTHIDFQQTDQDEMNAYPVPVYQSFCTFTCLAPAAVGTAYGVISDVSINPTFSTP